MKLKDNRTDILIAVSVISFTTMLFGVCRFWDLSNFGISILSGVFTGAFLLLIEELVSQHKMKTDFAWLQGEWNGSWDLKGRSVVPAAKSNVNISYKGKNVLLVTLKHDLDSDKPRIWEGTIEMNVNVTNKGSLIFKYNDSHESGYKEILVSSDNQDDYIYLFPVIVEAPQTVQYGIQVFKRSKAYNKE